MLNMQIRPAKDEETGWPNGEFYIAIVATNGEDWFVSETYANEGNAIRSAQDFAERSGGKFHIESVDG